MESGKASAAALAAVEKQQRGRWAATSSGSPRGAPSGSRRENAAKILPQLPFTYRVHADATSNPYERSQLRQDLRQASRDIYLAKHNDVAL